MKKHIILFAALVLPAGLLAQNLNPEVQVTNEYQTRIEDVSKQAPSMRVPDSLLRFDYHFDYSVFDSPYKGAYEFSPYSVNITPTPGTYDGRKLYLRTGAGYVFKPELDLVWSALDGKKAAVNVFASGNGFWGNYLRITPQTLVADKSFLDPGFDFGTLAGVDSRFNFGDFTLGAELGYEGIFTDHQIYHGSIGHAPYANLRFAFDKPNRFSYALSARYRYVNDRHDLQGRMEDHDVKVDAALTPYKSENMELGADFAFNYNLFYYGLELSPRLWFRAGSLLDVKAGMHLSYCNTVNVSPDVRLTFHVVRDYLDLYLAAEGHNYLLSYWDYKKFSHFYHTGYSDPLPFREIADCMLGARGRADFGLRYELKAGYRFMEGMPFWAVAADGKETLLSLDAQMLHADLDFSWEAERFDVEGAVRYIWMPQGVDARVFALPDVTASLSGRYNWRKRIYAGLSAAMSTARKAMVGTDTVEIPWYLDLGVNAEYKFNDKLSFWLKGTNLLNQEIRQSPIYCPYGPSVIAGIVLSL